MKPIVCKIFCLFFGLFIIGCASQRDVLILDERLKILERNNQMLNRQNLELKKKIETELKSIGDTSQSAESTLRGKYARLNADMDSLQQELRLLKGRTEEITYKLDNKIENYEAEGKRLQSQVAELGVQVGRLDKRIVTLEQYLDIDDDKASAGAKPSGKSKTQASDTKADAVRTLYNEAKQAFDNGQTDAARQGFQQVLKNYPNSAMADNAQYWIGETYFREKWYEKAILEYQAVIEKYPKGNKVASAMLKQGMAFLQLGDKSNARLILTELKKKYPQSSEAKIASKKLAEF